VFLVVILLPIIRKVLGRSKTKSQEKELVS